MTIDDDQTIEAQTPKIEPTNSEVKARPQTNNVVLVLGLLVMAPGLLFGFGFVCAGFVALIDRDETAFGAGLIALILAVLCLGGGFSLIWFGSPARREAAARPFRLWSPWTLAGIFGLAIVAGLITSQVFGFGLFFPPILLVAATMPPLIAVAWFSGTGYADLTWRRGVIAFIGGATLGVFVALVLEILFPALILALVADLAQIVLDQVEDLATALTSGEVAQAITSRGFIYIFIEVAIIAPLAEELAKPLIVLPWARRLTQQGAFLFGALAGAGFAALENILYAGFGFSFWAGILLVRALGGAIHPFGAGLVALGWRDLLRGEPHAGANWLARFGLAAGMHALWNGGSLLVITLAGARFFGDLPPEIDILGLSAAGTTLALLLIAGLIALWLGRTTINRLDPMPTGTGQETIPALVVSDRSLAIWALACLIAIVPAGIAGLQLWLH